MASYIDGIYVARATGSTTCNFMDVERIEVLRGPQGTLYGKNAIGGVMVISAQPHDTCVGKAELTVGEYDLREFRGTLNLPLVRQHGGQLSRWRWLCR